jgi:hypothetical protein
MNAKKAKDIKEIAPLHTEYWQTLGIDNYQGGPFSDRSGGLIRFSVNDFDMAQELISNDPFYQKDLLKEHWLKEWIIIS